jgi:hypothetical protein
LQTTSKFPFRWWGVNSTLSGKHQLHKGSGQFGEKIYAKL